MKCDLCKIDDATRDSKTIYGSWAYVCENCFARVGVDIPGMYTMLNLQSDTKDLEDIFQDILNMEVSS